MRITTSCVRQIGGWGWLSAPVRRPPFRREKSSFTRVRTPLNPQLYNSTHSFLSFSRELSRTSFIMSLPQIKQDFLSPILKKGRAQEYLEKIEHVVSNHSGAQIKLIKKYEFRVGSLKDTSYKEEHHLLEEWEQFYLPDEMKMVVIGVLENFPCRTDSAELVLMVCEDGNVFGYEDDRLHLVASSLKEMFESGVQFPGSKSYYRGQSFEDMTDDDWDKVSKSDEVREKQKRHQEILESLHLKNNLEIIEQRLRAEPAGMEKSERVVLPVS